MAISAVNDKAYLDHHILHDMRFLVQNCPYDLKIKQLVVRVASGGVKEIILATNPSMEGDATAQYLQT